MVNAGGRLAQHPRFSPDGRWLAYASNATGRTEVFVSAANGDGKRPVSSGGGTAPVWGRDGRTLYYRSGPHYFSVDVRQLPSIIGRPAALGKDLPLALGYGFGHAGYDVASDGRLLIVQPGADEAAPLRLEVVLNWFEELKQRVPVRK